VLRHGHFFSISEGSTGAPPTLSLDGQWDVEDSIGPEWKLIRDRSRCIVSRWATPRRLSLPLRRFRRFIGRDRVILGISALEQLKTMGGGDFDDAVIGTSNLN
jgi:hypothetical protein